MLEKYFDLSNYKLRNNSDIDLYPKINNREAWNNISAKEKEKLISDAEEFLHCEYPALPAMNYYKLYTEDSRDPYMVPYDKRRTILMKLVLGECVEHKGRFIEDIINGIYAICDEATWIDPAHSIINYENVGSKRDILPNRETEMIDLSSASTGVFMAFVYYLLKEELDAFSPLICRYIESEINKKIINPYLSRNDIWWMTYGNNWNTGCNFEIAIMATLMPLDESTYRKVIEKTIWSVDCFFKEYPYDGGCEEGTSYWHSDMAADYFEWLIYISYGKINPCNEQQIMNMARYELNMYVGKNRYVTVADSHLDLTGDYIGLLYKIGRLSGIEELKIMAAERGDLNDDSDPSLKGALDRLFVTKESDLKCYLGKPIVFEKSVWYDSIQTAVFRETDKVGGLFFTIKGGHNEEIHNHNDVGNFALFNDCEPIVIDAGIGNYSNTAFSELRYTLDFFNSKYHNVPYIGGVEQKAKRSCKATNVSHTENSVCMDIAEAYDDESILHWVREVYYNRDENEINFKETYEFTDEKEFSLHFLVLQEPEITEGKVILNGGVVLYYDDMEASFQEVQNLDEEMRKYWKKIFRLKFSSKGKSGVVKYRFKTV